jgi:hypothetical protein
MPLYIITTKKLKSAKKIYEAKGMYVQ